MMNLAYFCSDQSAEKAAIQNERQVIELQRSRWQAAKGLGICAMLTVLAKHLGHDPASIDENGNVTGYCAKHGPKRRLRIAANGDITLTKADAAVEIYWDGYGNYTTVSANEKRVYSSHPCDQYIIPGEWLATALILQPEADKAIAIKEAQRSASKLRQAVSRV